LKATIQGGIATKLITIGIGDQISQTELNNMASDPDSENVITTDNFDSLADLQLQLSSTICEGLRSSVISE